MSAPRANPDTERPPVRALMDIARTFLTAMMLAFIFRAFLVEAFIIPTGSMAQGLLGAHRAVICADCGMQYDISAADRPFAQTSATIRVRCPNCLNSDEREEATAPWRAGDRILVHKWAYDLSSLFAPRRWEVIVFRDPADAAQNYIKRVAALPNETIEIVAGDVYINERIARKPIELQDHLWIPVFHQDMPPNEESPFFTGPVWNIPAGEARSIAWSGMNSRVVHYEPDDTEPHALEFAAHASPTYLQDFAAYNGQTSGAYTRDWRIAFELTPIGGAGRITVDLELAEARHELTIHSQGRVELRSRQTTGGQILQQTRLASFAAHGDDQPVVIEFACVDDARYVRIDGRLLLSTADQPGMSVSEARELQTDTAAKLRLVAEGWTFDLNELRVDRDIFYTRRPGTALRAYAGEPFTLGPDEYFVLGDNSAASHDSREWRTIGRHLDPDYRLGTVPRREIVGRAFFVYLPGLMPIDGSGRFRIPDIGSIRFVR